MSRIWGTIYVNPNSKSTKILDQFLAKYIDQINKRVFLKIVRVTNTNVEGVKKRGIEHTPTLVIEGKSYVGLEKIVKVLTPPTDQRDSFGMGNTSPNDLINQYQQTILNTGDDNKEDNDMDPDVRSNVLREKMAQFQKRRPAMEGVDKSAKVTGGRRVHPGSLGKSKFDTDDDFRRASGVDNITETPSQRYMDEADGDSILEDWYLQEAINSGKKVGKTVGRRRR